MEINEFLNSIDRGESAGYLTPKVDSYGNFNVSPTQSMPVAYVDEEGNRVLENMSWGFIRWKPRPGAKPFRPPVNSRDDKLVESKMWNHPFQTTRCIVPLSGFYEWTGPKGKKTPHYIYPKEQSYFAAAGLYSNIGPEDSGLKSYSIITTAPNKTMEDIHDRMPAFLHPEEFDEWLNPDRELDYLLDMINSYPDDAMDTHIVSKEVGNTRNNHSGLIEKSELF